MTTAPSAVAGKKASARNSRPGKGTRDPRLGKKARDLRQPGFYDKLFSAEEIRALETRPQLGAEQDLLRTVVRRLVKLTPLKQLNDKEVKALLKLVRLIAVIDALERTEVMRRKGGVIDDPLLESFAVDALEDL